MSMVERDSTNDRIYIDVLGQRSSDLVSDSEYEMKCECAVFCFIPLYLFGVSAGFFFRSFFCVN